MSSLAHGSAPVVTVGSGVLEAFQYIDVSQLLIPTNLCVNLYRQIKVVIPSQAWNAVNTTVKYVGGASSPVLASIATIVIVASAHQLEAVSISSTSADSASAGSTVCPTSITTSAA